MRKALVHNCAQLHKVTNIHVFSQPRTGISSRAHVFCTQTSIFEQRTRINSTNGFARLKCTQLTEGKKNRVIYEWLQRLLVSSQSMCNDELKQ